MSQASGIVLWVVIVGTVFFISFYFSRRNRIRRQLRKLPMKPIGQFMNGDVARTEGHVVLAGNVLTAPLSKRACSFYYVEVQERRQSGKSSHWHTIIKEELSGDVLLHDGTHYALVETAMINAHLMLDREFTSGTWNDASPELEAYLQQRGRSSVGWMGFNKSLRYREGVLEAGELVTVSGHGKWIPRPASLPRVNARQVLHLTPSGEQHVYLTDEPV